MERRDAVRVVTGTLAGLLGGCLGAPPRASGPRHAPEAAADRPRRTPTRPDLAIGTFDFEATDGALRVFGTVENRSTVQRTTTVAVTVRVGGDEFERESAVTVAAEGTASWSLTFDVAYDAFTSNGDLNVTLA
ncbi:transcriptional initiation protein Tat [Halobellus sp. Atlit-31R]|nr:transcriptional initiation protein Tat [Halobellus sp. Atlit-31R]